MKVLFLSFIDSYHMLYFIIRPIVRLTFRIFFSKIYLHRLDRIPRDRPVLISSNHPSAFLEACLLATHFQGTLHFLVRGDIFVNKFVIWILAQLHLTPIFRFSDGFKNMRSNESTFNACYKRLANGETIVVYSEGNTTQEKRLRPIQKGLARIAFGAMDLYPNMNLCIVPLGVNYTYPNDFRSEVFVEVGEVIELDQYYAKYKEDSIKGISELTQCVEQAMKPLVIHINKDEDLPLADKLWMLNKANSNISFWPVVNRTGDRYYQDKKTADAINQMDESDKARIFNQVVSSPSNTSNGVILNMLSIPAWLGKFLNSLPLRITKRITTTKVKRIEFFSSVMVGTGMFLYIFYILIVALISFVLGWNAGFIVLIIMLTGLTYLYFSFKQEQAKLTAFKQANKEIQIN